MDRLRIIGLVLLTLFALGALSASMATAEEGALPAEPSSGTGGVTTLETEKEQIQCKEAKILEAKFLTEKEKDQRGTAVLHLTGCKAEKLDPANTLGDESGVILIKVSFLLCLVEPKTLVYGVLVEPLETAHVEAPLIKALMLVKGAVIAQAKAGQSNKGTEFTFVLKGEKGKQTEATKCEINGKEFKHTLEYARDSEAKDAPASEAVTFTLTFPKEVELMDS